MRDQKGIVALVAILVVSVVGLAIGISLLLISTSGSKSSISHQKSAQAKSLADTCADVALNVIKNNNSFTGTANVILGAGNCDYTVTNGGGENRTITTVGTVDNVKRHVSITVDQITPSINLVSWQEVP